MMIKLFKYHVSTLLIEMKLVMVNTSKYLKKYM